MMLSLKRGYNSRKIQEVTFSLIFDSILESFLFILKDLGYPGSHFSDLGAYWLLAGRQAGCWLLAGAPQILRPRPGEGKIFIRGGRRKPYRKASIHIAAGYRTTNIQSTRLTEDISLSTRRT